MFAGLDRHCLAHRGEVLARNGGFVLSGHLPLVGRYAFVAADSPAHPSSSKPSPTHRAAADR